LGEEFRGGETVGDDGVIEEDAERGDFADVGYVVAGGGVAVCGCFFDGGGFWVGVDCWGVVRAGGLNGGDEAVGGG